MSKVKGNFYYILMFVGQKKLIENIEIFYCLTHKTNKHLIQIHIEL